MAKPHFAILKFKQPLPSTVYLIFFLLSRALTPSYRTRPLGLQFICMIHSNLPLSPIIFLVFRDKSRDPSFREALSTASLSIIHWDGSFEILLCFFFFFFLRERAELNWKETSVEERMPRRHLRIPFMLHPAKPPTTSRVCLWHFVSTPNKPLWQYSLKKFPYPRTRPQLPSLPAIAHQGSMYTNALLLGQDMDPLSSGGCWAPT